MKKVKKIPNCCSYNSPGFTYSQPFQTDAQMVLDLKLSYEHPPNATPVFYSVPACHPQTVLSFVSKDRREIYCFGLGSQSFRHILHAA